MIDTLALPPPAGGRSTAAAKRRRSGGGDTAQTTGVRANSTPPRRRATRGADPPPTGEGLFRRVELLPRILHVGDRVDLDVGEPAGLHVGAADVDVLDDVARLRVDHDRPARAVRVLPALEDRHHLVA